MPIKGIILGNCFRIYLGILVKCICNYQKSVIVIAMLTCSSILHVPVTMANQFLIPGCKELDLARGEDTYIHVYKLILLPEKGFSAAMLKKKN